MQKGGMNMKKRVLALVLCAVLAVTMAAPAMAAFPDLEGHWAQSYMEDLADRGYLSGYDDGTMGPERNITSCEALVFLSRFYKTDETLREWIDSDYAAYVAELVPASLSWAYDEIELCLAAGIISQRELIGMNLSQAIEKELLSVFLVRAMQLEEAAEAADGSGLAFDDVSDITESYLGHAEVLVNAGIIQGDDANCFDPHRNVTRAVVATMVVRALDYVADSGVELRLNAYDGYSKTVGIITGVSGSDVVVRGYDGISYKYAVGDNAEITVNGSARTLTSAYIGCFATVKREARIVSAVEIEKDADVSYIQGRISSRGNYNNNNVVLVSDLKGEDAVRYVVPDTAVITLDGKEIAFNDIEKNKFVTLRMEDGVIAEVNTGTSEREVVGTVALISYGAEVILDIKDAQENVYSFNVDITDLPVVKRGEVTISFDRLSVGDEVIFSVENCRLTTIVTDGEEETYSGTLTSITNSVNGTFWIITGDSGITCTLEVDPGALVYKDGRSIMLSDVKLGDLVDVTTNGGIVTEVNVEEAAATTTKITGTVLAADNTTRTITALVSGKLVYIDTRDANIISAVTGENIRLTSIKADDTILSYGVYVNASEFDATSVIVE